MVNNPSPGPIGSVESIIIKSYKFSFPLMNLIPSSKNNFTLGSSNLFDVNYQLILCRNYA